jgi:predicted amidophosphoribosyltransferase
MTPLRSTVRRVPRAIAPAVAGSVVPVVREAVLDALAVLSPVTCSGCGALDRGLCAVCLAALTPHPEHIRDAGAGPPVWAALDYSGVTRAVLLAYKDHGRTDAMLPLGRALRAAVIAASGHLREVGACEPAVRAGGVVLVTIPSTRAAFRRRGYHPTASALRRAGLIRPLTPPSLRLVRRAADQAGLSASERSMNRFGSFAASPRLAGRACLIVDDIVTSGATVREAARAIEAVGGVVVGAAAIAHTELRRARKKASTDIQESHGRYRGIAGSQVVGSALR